MNLRPSICLTVSSAQDRLKVSGSGNMGMDKPCYADNNKQVCI
jgi:hypothetical protein